MIKRVDHVSIAVRDLGRAKAFFIDGLGGKELFSGPAEGQGFRWTLIELGTSCLIELIDPMGEEGFGLLLEYPEAKVYSLSEEHGVVDFGACADRPEVGERVTVVPNHVCPVSNLFNQVVGVRGEVVQVVWPVAARGALQ